MNGEILNGLRHRLLTRNTLLFLFFLALSAGFWLFLTLNEQYEEDFEVRIELKNVPRGIVITDGPPKTLRLTLSDRGLTLLNYQYGDTLPPVVIDFNAYANANGHVRISTSELLKQVQKRLAAGTHIQTAKPEAVEFFYNRGNFKRVPVRMADNANAAYGHVLLGRTLTPDSVNVYASRQCLDTLSAVYTEPAYLRDIKESSTMTLRLQHIYGAKITPDSVRLNLRADRLVEKSVSVEVTGVNVPEGYRMRTFPTTVNVTCQVAMSQYNHIREKDFVVTANYAEIPEGGTICHIRLTSTPAGAQFCRLHTNEVEYVLDPIQP